MTRVGFGAVDWIPRPAWEALEVVAAGLCFEFSPQASGGEDKSLHFKLGSHQTPIAFAVSLRDDTRRIHVLASVNPKFFISADRTDITSILTLGFATAVRGQGISADWFFDESFAGGEVDLAFLTFEQPVASFAPDREGVGKICDLLMLAVLTWRAFFQCENTEHMAYGEHSVPSGNFDFVAAEEWAKPILRALRLSSGKVNYSRRHCPQWSHFVDLARGTTIVKSKGFVRFCKRSIERLAEKRVAGVSGTMFVSNAGKHFVASRDSRLGLRLLRALGEQHAPNSICSVAFEQHVLFLGDEHAVSLFRGCGRIAFDLERERVRTRHLVESELLFPASRFEWASPIPDDKFEELICELLGREAEVVRVRKSGPTRQADAGRDLLIDWVISPSRQSDLSEPATKRVIGQCKAMRDTVGKSKVRDIVDTVEGHDGQGFFLAVASEASSGLVEYLDRIARSRHWFVDWWTRIEIEERLRRHKDIADRYPMMVSAKHP